MSFLFFLCSLAGYVYSINTQKRYLGDNGNVFETCAKQISIKLSTTNLQYNTIQVFKAPRKFAERSSETETETPCVLYLAMTYC